MVGESGARAFVGRDRELAALRTRRRALARKQGGVVLIGGPGGIGKSRLVSEFARTIAGGRAPTLVRTEALEFGGTTFGPVRDIVSALVAGRGTELDGQARSALERGTFFSALERIIRDATSRRAAIVCLEDLHWADPATLEFIAHLASRIAADRLLVLATYRDDEIETRPEAAAALGRIESASATQRIVLAPLPPSDIRKLLSSGGAGAEPDPQIVRRVVARAAGNPLYAEELLRASLAGDESLPLSIRGAVFARLATLDPTDQRVLAHAAVLGYRFDPLLLARTLECATADIERALTRARERHLVVEEPAAAISFRFSHALTHEAIANRMLELQARTLHERVARMLESLPDAARRIDERAYHWWKARDASHAVPACEEAGSAAMALHAYRDAEAFFERALELTRDPEVRCRLSAAAGLAAFAQGEHARARAHYEVQLALELAASDWSRAAETVRRIAGRLVNEGRSAEARTRLWTFLESHGGELSPVGRLLIEGWPILMDVGGGDPRGWLDRLERCTNVASASLNERWCLLLLEVNAHAYVGNVSAWQRAVERLQRFGTDGVPVSTVISHAAVAVTAAYLGIDRASARDAVDRAHAACDDLGVSSYRAFVSTADAFDRYLHGDLHGAREATRAALPDGADTNHRETVAAVGSLVAYDLDDAELEALVSPAAPAADERGGRSQTAALALAGPATRLLALGRDDDARLVLERAVIALHTTFGAQFVLPLAARHATSESARIAIEELMKKVAADDRSGQATLAMVRAQSAMRTRDPDAVALARAASARYAELGWPLLQANALELAGETAAAREIYVRCGSIRQARRLRRGAMPAGALAERDHGILTSRESDVARLVAAGLGNVAIGSRLGLSVKTVETHLSRIYRRLGFRSRAQLGAYVAQRGAGRITPSDASVDESPDRSMLSEDPR